MKKKFCAVGFCALLLAGNYAAMQFLGASNLTSPIVPEIDEPAAVLIEHEWERGETILYVPTISVEERAVLEDIAARDEALQRNARVSNRPMSDDESERMTSLMRGYTRSLRLPERSLPLKKTDSAVWYDPAALSYQYPPNEMDDEMLLELIEFDAKLNLIYAERAQADALAPVETELTEKQAIDAAKQAIWQFYSVDPEPYDIYASLIEYEEQRVWDISFFPPNDDLLSDTGKYYLVLGAEVDSSTGMLLYLDKTENRAHDMNIQIDQMSKDHLSACEDTAMQLLKNLNISLQEPILEGIYTSSKYPDIVYVVVDSGKETFWRIGLDWPELSPSGFQSTHSLNDAVEGLTLVK
ncbi:hypothetical protein D7X33_23110 [Butyricicoccus sp. 1XD8-22]|nr:hypothetical protein D7X33_23110 [Butyricicoccus sp. 1XD8-22]